MKSKAELRAELKNRTERLSASDKASEAQILCQNLQNSLTLDRASSVGVFLALSDEPDLRNAYRTLLKQNKILALPFPSENGKWGFYSIVRLETENTGEWGLGFPEKGTFVPADELDVVLVPGRGFTPAGDRIGRGKGIYDRLLAGTKAKKIGVCFSCQIVDQLPMDEHDIRMDEVWCS
jgi:5-formyltetrahydrofolate cyclo-ligase